MTLNKTTGDLKDLLHHITKDLEKAENGNKAAAQRVRTGTIRLEKVAKLYRKESIKEEKQGKGKKSAKRAASPAKKAAKKSVAAKTPAAKKVIKGPAEKSKKTSTKVNARALSFKRRPTAKLPNKRRKAAR